MSPFWSRSISLSCFSFQPVKHDLQQSGLHQSLRSSTMSIKKTSNMASANRNGDLDGHESSLSPNTSSDLTEGSNHPQAGSQDAMDHTDTNRARARSMASASDRGPRPAVNGTASASSLGQPQLDLSDLPNVNIDELRQLRGALLRNDVRPDHGPASSSSPRSPTVHAKNEEANATNSSTDQDDWSIYTRPSNFTMFISIEVSQDLNLGSQVANTS